MPITKVANGIYSIKDESVAFVNSIRRIVLAEIANIAFNPDLAYMTIKTNTGNLHNEMLAHRISFVPICAPPERFEEMTRTTFKLKLKNTTETVMHLTAGHFTAENELGPVDCAELFPRNPITGEHVLITKLLPGQEVDIVAKPQMGTAKEHARWGVVSKCSYMNALDEELVAQERRNWQEAEKDMSIFESHQKYRHFKRNIFGEPCEFELYIDSECAMSPDWILQRAITILTRKCERLVEDKAILCDTDEHDMITIKIPNEDYTLLNYIQSSIYDREVRGSKCLSYIGYFKPHPLQDEMILKLKFRDDKAHPDSVMDWLAEQMRVMAADLTAKNVGYM